MVSFSYLRQKLNKKMKPIQKQIFAQEMSLYTKDASIEDTDEPSTVCLKAKGSLISFRKSKKKKSVYNKKKTLRRFLFKKRDQTDNAFMKVLLGFIVMAMITAGCVSLLPNNVTMSVTKDVASAITKEKSSKLVNESLPIVTLTDPDNDKKTKQFYYKAIKGDGNCMFRSLAYLAYHNENKYKEIKNIIKKELNEHKDRYNVAACKVTDGSCDSNYDVDTYIRNILDVDYAWGDDISLSAYHNATRKCIYVYSKIADRWIHKIKNNKGYDNNQIYHLQWQQSRTGEGLHYEVLVPL